MEDDKLVYTKYHHHQQQLYSGRMQICSVVQLSGFFLCLLGAARITHRAQGIVSIATRWNMILTSSSARSDQGKCSVPEIDKTLVSESAVIGADSSEILVSISSQYPSSFQTRQAFGK